MPAALLSMNTALDGVNCSSYVGPDRLDGRLLTVEGGVGLISVPTVSLGVRNRLIFVISSVAKFPSVLGHPRASGTLPGPFPRC